MNTTWRKELAVMMESNMDLCDYVCTLSEEEMDIVFDDGFGIEEGLAFTAWTDDYVYFPLCYDGVSGLVVFLAIQNLFRLDTRVVDND